MLRKSKFEIELIKVNLLKKGFTLISKQQVNKTTICAYKLGDKIVNLTYAQNGMVRIS